MLAALTGFLDSNRASACMGVVTVTAAIPA
jgi:hypothetical protein